MLMGSGMCRAAQRRPPTQPISSGFRSVRRSVRPHRAQGKGELPVGVQDKRETNEDRVATDAPLGQHAATRGCMPVANAVDGGGDEDRDPGDGRQHQKVRIPIERVARRASEEKRWGGDVENEPRERGYHSFAKESTCAKGVSQPDDQEDRQHDVDERHGD